MATVNSGDTTTVVPQYNDLQSRVNNIMGTGPQPQRVWSGISKCPAHRKCRIATQMDNLRTDIKSTHTTNP